MSNNDVSSEIIPNSQLSSQQATENTQLLPGIDNSNEEGIETRTCLCSGKNCVTNNDPPSYDEIVNNPSLHIVDDEEYIIVNKPIDPQQFIEINHPITLDEQLPLTNSYYHRSRRNNINYESDNDIETTSHLLPSFFSCLCCNPCLGCFAIIFSFLSVDANERGARNESKCYAKIALTIAIATILLGLFVNLLIIIICRHPTFNRPIDNICPINSPARTFRLHSLTSTVLNVFNNLRHNKFLPNILKNRTSSSQPKRHPKFFPKNTTNSSLILSTLQKGNS
ncbi:hypothetical protein SNEBB_006806 [Seison nebaliae]|nr:hypothetical protein SNEBB_006806 [Seison nebaliae]